MSRGEGVVVTPGENPTGGDFSGYDKASNSKLGIQGYLLTPGGHVRKYTPLPKSDEFDVGEGLTKIVD
jgi:hypothetical protein